MPSDKINQIGCDVTIRIGGEAGQGMQLISGLLGKTFLRSGFQVFTHQNVMSRIRGGHNYSQIRLRPSPISAPSSQVHVLVCLDKITRDLYSDIVKEVVIYDPENGEESKPDGDKDLPIPMKKLALEKGRDERMVNTVAYGSVLAVLGLPLDPLLNLIEEVFAAKGEKIIHANKECARAGYDLARDRFKKNKLCPNVPAKSDSKNVLITGSEAMALGAIASNLRFYSAYPMSPATPIMEFLASKKEEYGLVVEQAEDEISAANMVIGAFFAGARAMTATSGGGLALMVEAVSLAGMTETPLVIVNCQRPAPATGLPTRTEQGDLWFVIHCAHGEFPRAVLAPATAEEAFFLISKAFYIAEKFQTPVFVLGDQYLNDSSWTAKPFDLKEISQKKEALVSAEDIADISSYEYRRYEITESGISPRILPGTPNQVLYADSDEHTEEGHITEKAEVRHNMVQKRLRKFRGLREELAPPKIFPDAKAEMYTVSWGSTLGAVDEAIHQLRQKGMNIGCIHFSELYPLKKNAIPSEIRDGARLIGVENNATGQLAALLKMEIGVSIDKQILKFDGRPFTTEELVWKIEKLRGE